MHVFDAVSVVQADISVVIVVVVDDVLEALVAVVVPATAAAMSVALMDFIYLVLDSGVLACAT